VKPYFRLTIAFVALCFFIIGYVAGGIIYAAGGGEVFFVPSALLTKYDGFVGGLLAFGAGLLAYFGIRDQLNQTAAMEEERRKREEVAARVVLPLALSATLDYCQSCCKLIAELFPASSHAHGINMRISKLPPLPRTELLVQQNTLRFATEPQVTQLSQLLIFSQIQNSRLTELADRSESTVVTRYSLLARLCDAVKLHFFASRLFEYARGTPPPSGRALSFANSAFNCGIVIEDIEGLENLISRREELLASDPYI